MSSGDLVQVTVVADEAWQAEITATTALLMPSGEALRWLNDKDITAILLTVDRTLVTTEKDDEGADHG
jgi:thiamine biosynthesis lipoprotein ApbE